MSSIELQPESSSIEDILNLLERREEAPSPAEARREMARVEAPPEMARVEEPPEIARVEEPAFTSHLAPTDPPVGWHVPSHHRVDELKVENRLFRESTRGEDGSRDAVPADRRTVPPPSSEPASTGALLPRDWFIDVEVAPIAPSGMPVLEIVAEPLASHEQEAEPEPEASVRPERPEATAVVGRADTTLTQAYDYEPAPVPSRPAFRAAEHVADAEPVVARVAPSVQRVRAAAARRRLTRVRTGIGRIAEASGGALRAGLAGIGSACSFVASGTARAFAGLAKGLGATARAAGASCLEMLEVCARAVRAAGAASAATLSALARGLGVGVRSLGAVCVLALRVSGRVAATVAVGSLWSLRAVGRAGRATAGAALTSSARAIRATRTVGMAALTLMARAIGATARAGRGVGALLLTGIGRTAVATARAGRASAALVLDASTWAIRSAGSGGSVIVTLLSRALRTSARAARSLGSTAAGGAGRATLRASSSTATASGPVVMRGYYFVGDLAARFLRPVLRPGYLFAALLVIAAVAGVPYAKAYWFSLKPQTGTLRVESARPGLTVRVDGVTRGTTPLSTALAVGRHRIEVDGGGRTRAQDVVVTAGQNTVVQLSGGATRGAGTLRLNSEPAGAQVWLDGAPHGTAPLTIEDVAEGLHTVVVREAGGTVRQTIRVRADETVEATIPIGPGWLAVFAPVRLDIMEDGRVIGTSEGGRIRARPGEHTLELVGELIGFRETRKVEVKPGVVVALSIELPAATLEVVAPADAEILIDGQLIGTAPLAPFAVAPGTREVSMRHPTLGEQRQMTTITYRTPNKVIFEPPN
jgi:hypothetical protein